MSNEIDNSVINDDYLEQQRRSSAQNNMRFWEDMADSMNIARAKANELEGFVAFNHEFLRGVYDPERDVQYGESYETEVYIENETRYDEPEPQLESVRIGDSGMDMNDIASSIKASYEMSKTSEEFRENIADLTPYLLENFSQEQRDFIEENCNSYTDVQNLVAEALYCNFKLNDIGYVPDDYAQFHDGDIVDVPANAYSEYPADTLAIEDTSYLEYERTTALAVSDINTYPDVQTSLAARDSNSYSGVQTGLVVREDNFHPDIQTGLANVNIDNELENGEWIACGNSREVVEDETGNMSNAYSYSAELAYMGIEAAKSAVRDTDTYRGAHTVNNAIRMAQGMAATISARGSADDIIDFMRTDTASNVGRILESEVGLFTHNTADMPVVSKGELFRDFSRGKNELDAYLKAQGLDLTGIRNSDILRSIEDNKFNFGLKRDKTLTADEKELLKAYVALDNMQLSMGKENAKIATAKATWKNVAKNAYRESEAYEGYRKLNSAKKAAGKAVFNSTKARIKITNGAAAIGNRVANARFSRQMRGASPERRAQINARVLETNRVFAARQSARNTRLARINRVQEFYNASALGKVRMIGSSIKRTEAYKQSALGRMEHRHKERRAQRKAQRKAQRIQRNPNRYARKQRRKQRRKNISRGLSVIKKKLMIIAAVFVLVVLLSNLVTLAIGTFISETPFAGIFLKTTEYNNVRQEAMNNAISEFVDAQDMIINGKSKLLDSNKIYSKMYSATVTYPDGKTVEYSREPEPGKRNLTELFKGKKDSRTIKNLRIPWTYEGTSDSGATLKADGYLGQSNFKKIYQVDDDGEIIDEVDDEDADYAPKLYSDLKDMKPRNGWIRGFNGRPTYEFDNWNGEDAYICGGDLRTYTLDDFFKAVSAMAVEICDITGYDDEDGKFYKKYFAEIVEMAIQNSYYSVDVTVTPKEGYLIFKDDNGVEYKDNAYVVDCQIYLHLDASINDLMMLADHYDPTTDTFKTDRSSAIMAWQSWISQKVGYARHSGYTDEGDTKRVFEGFFLEDSPGFKKEPKFASYKDRSGFPYDTNNMTDEGDTACSYLYQGLTLNEWINEMGFDFLESYSLEGNVTAIAPVLSPEQIDDYMVQINSNYVKQYGEELSKERAEFLRQCLEDCGRFYYNFGGKASVHGDPPMGLDCSGFVGYELYKAGLISNPVQSTDSLEHDEGKKVPVYNRKKPGDIIVKWEPSQNTDTTWGSHVVIYLGEFDDGDGVIEEHTVECTTSNGSGSQILKLNPRRSRANGYDCVKRFFDK